jgi:heme-degrading monooxygenase HmoA
MILSTDLDLVNTIERYDVPAQHQDQAVGIARQTIRDAWLDNAGFVAALVLRGRQHGGLATYAQWRKSEAGTFPKGPAVSRSRRLALGDYALIDSRNYELAFTRQAPLTAAAGRTCISLAATPFIHFGIFRVTPENQSLLLERAEAEAPNSFGTPGLLAIDFHRSADRMQVLNLGAWSTFDGFNALHQRPSFKPGEQYFRDLADFTANFFDLTDVVVRAVQAR